MTDDFDFDFYHDDEPVPPPVPEVPHVPMRTQFPEAGSDYMGGFCDGWEYRTAFGGAHLTATYQMVRTFLEEEGYGDIPLPATAEELKLFRRPKDPQLKFWMERGYIHNPVKILFSDAPKQRNTLILCIYNEAAPDHLLRFHGVKRK